MSYNKIISDIKQNKFSNIYLLHGEESYYIDRIEEALIQNVLEDHERDFNQSVLYGKDITVGNILDEVQQFPMMSERRLVIVREAQNLKKSISELVKYAESPMKSTILVICYKYENLDGRSSFVSRCTKEQTVFKSEKEQLELQKAYQSLIFDLAKFLSENNFKWGKTTKCFNRIYFNENGKIDYFLFNFSEGEITNEKEKEFSRKVFPSSPVSRRPWRR